VAETLLDEVVFSTLTRTPRWDDTQGKYIWEAKAPEPDSEPEPPRPQDLPGSPHPSDPKEDPRTLTFKDVYPAYGYHREGSAKDDPLLGFDPESNEPESDKVEPDFNDDQSNAILDALPAEVPAYIKAILLLLLGRNHGRSETD